MTRPSFVVHHDRTLAGQGSRDGLSTKVHGAELSRDHDTTAILVSTYPRPISF